MSRLVVSHGEEETRRLGRELGVRLAPDGTLLLFGEMGSGKTVLARGVAEGLGIDGAEIQSPTFTLVHEHHGSGGDLVHIDLYRLEPAEAEAIGLEEILARRAVKVVEWAERLPFDAPGGARVRLERAADGTHRIELLDDPPAAEPSP